MTAFELTIVALSVQCTLYLLFVAVALKRGSLRDGIVRTLILYAIVSGLWVVEQLAWRMGWLDPLHVDAQILVRVPLYGILLLSLLFLYLTRSFLRLRGLGWSWAVLGVAWIAALVLLDTNTLGLPDVLWAGEGWSIDRVGFTFGLLIAGWAILMGAAIQRTLKSHRQAELPLHKNRIKYWPLAWSVVLAGDLFFFAGQEVIGSDVRLLGAVLAAYMVLTHRLPDVRQTMRRVVSYLIITLLTVAIYTAGFTAVQYFFQNVPGYSPLWGGAAVALILAVLFDPLLALVQKLVNRLISGVGYDPGRKVSEYSLKISNIVSMERLATVAVGLIQETLKIRRGALFVVNFEKDEQGAKGYELRGVRGMEEDTPPSGTLSADSPVTRHLRETRRPLTQYDIDLLPAFQQIAGTERAWLSGLGMDVYVPIHAQESWIGLLALGPKVSGDRYFDEDLVLLSTLADQTAVALENARLVEDLIEINHDLEQAYATLAQANRQLQEMDRLKSAFIGAITHELRSPFANIAFSLQLFTRQGVENLTPEQREQLEQLTSSLKQAKAMVDNLVTFATFLSKQGELQLAELDFRELLSAALLPLQSMAETKDLTFYITVPEELPPVKGDRDRLSDAVHHLVHNAIKFTEAGGEIWILSQPTDKTILFEVKDTGVGIPAGQLPTLWEGFAQMADPLKRGVEGLGLGLALVKYIVGAHDGRVWAESEEGVGSTFGFEIPLSGPATTAQVAAFSERQSMV